MRPAFDGGHTDDELRDLWKNAGGLFHGPHVETGTMPEATLLPMLRKYEEDSKMLDFVLDHGDLVFGDERLGSTTSYYVRLDGDEWHGESWREAISRLMKAQK